MSEKKEDLEDPSSAGKNTQSNPNYYLLECTIVGWEIINRKKKITIRPDVTYSGKLAGDKNIGLMIKAKDGTSFEVSDPVKVREIPSVLATPPTSIYKEHFDIDEGKIDQNVAPSLFSECLSAILLVEESLPNTSYKIIGAKIPNN